MKKAILGSLLLAVLHSILFYGKDLGISVLLFAIPSLILLIFLLKKHGQIKNKKALYLIIPIVLLSSTYLFFNNTFFNQLNLIIIPFFYASMIIWMTIDVISAREWFGKTVTLVVGSLEFIPNAIRLITGAVKLHKKKDTKYQKVRLVIIGILCSIPILCIILSLLISADGIFADIFGKFLKNTEDILTTKSIINLIGRVVVILAVTIYLVCIVYNITNKNSSYHHSKNIQDAFKITIDTTILNTILTMINVVYLIFSGVQIFYVFTYFFGGNNPNFNFASYARQGFFQLMFITFINLVLILIANLNKKQEKIYSYTKIMNVLMCIFTMIIALSAVMRMYLYEKEYGYTFLRLMVYFILATELFMILPTISYIIKEKGRLLRSYFIIGTIMYLIVNFSNIDYLIAKNNVDRALKANGEIIRKTDTCYLTRSLGTDATSQLLYLYEHLEDKEEKRILNNYLYNQYKKVNQETSWQSFNLSKQHTKNLLKDLNLKYENTTSNQYYNRYDDFTI